MNASLLSVRSLVLFATLTVSSTLWSGAVTKPHTFVSGKAISSSQMNENFDVLIGALGALTGDVTGNSTMTKVVGIQGYPVSAAVPTSGDVLTFNGTAWAPAVSGGSYLPLSGGNLTGSLGITGGLTTSGAITASGALAATSVSTGAITSASGGISATTGNITATAGGISANNGTISAGTFTSPGSGASSEKFGLGSTATGANSIVIGNGATCSLANTLVVGSPTSSIDKIYFGKGVSHASPTSINILGTDSTGNNPGANLSIAAGLGNPSATAASLGGNLTLSAGSGGVNGASGSTGGGLALTAGGGGNASAGGDGGSLTITAGVGGSSGATGGTGGNLVITAGAGGNASGNGNGGNLVLDAGLKGAGGGNDGQVTVGSNTAAGVLVTTLDVKGVVKLKGYASQPFACTMTNMGALVFNTNTYPSLLCICIQYDGVPTYAWKKVDGTPCIGW